MQSKISLRQSLFIGSIVGIAFFPIIFFLNKYLPAQDSYTKADSTSVESIRSAALKEQASSGLPIRLRIPKIHVDAPVEYVGLLPDGAMDVPKSPAEVAWFELGPNPGEGGSAVIAGHYGWKNGKASAFDNLHQLRKGDKIYIENGNGETLSFVVRESRRYDSEADASEVFSSNDGKSHLNLITCEGVWNKVSKSYSNRLVVFTDKEMDSELGSGTTITD